MNTFLIGLVAGVFIGALAVLAISLMVTASRADEEMERYFENYREDIDLPLPSRPER